MNLAAAVNVILYDRLAKRGRLDFVMRPPASECAA
jgi:tRNA(Leu) C34 or U34 (ribose-2'-O)-methylase TrmL